MHPVQCTIETDSAAWCQCGRNISLGLEDRDYLRNGGDELSPAQKASVERILNSIPEDRNYSRLTQALIATAAILSVGVAIFYNRESILQIIAPLFE